MLKFVFTFLFTFVAGLGLAQAAKTYKVTITNSGSMPISPGALYSSRDALPAEKLGEMATTGFVQLCQTGNPDGRIAELQSDPRIHTIVKTDGPIFPGESRTVEIKANGKKDSLHFAAMYGKSKDVCGLVTVDRQDLIAVNYKMAASALGSEKVIATGAFSDPVLPEGGVSEAQSLCAQSNSGIDCLRNLAFPIDNGKIHTFTSYLPSLLNFLESEYGSADALSLVVPTAGAIQVKVERKR